MYNIKFLRDKDFDALPVEVTKGSDISDSLGFYNPDIKQAYIRYTASDELNKYLLNHEFEHMIEGDEHATDVDENGIRHKKGGFKRFLQVFYNPLNIGGMGPLTNQDKGFAQTANKSKPENVQADLENQIYSQQKALPDYGYNMFTQQQSLPQAQSNPAGYATYGGGTTDSMSSGLSGGLGGTNQNSQSNPFASDDERFQYGAPAGRLTF